MCTLGSDPEDYLYHGKVLKVSYSYSETNIIERVSATLLFKKGEITFFTPKALNICKNDIVWFYITFVDNEMVLDEIVKVEKPQIKKVTTKQRQANRLMEANY